MSRYENCPRLNERGITTTTVHEGATGKVVPAGSKGTVVDVFEFKLDDPKLGSMRGMWSEWVVKLPPLVQLAEVAE